MAYRNQEHKNEAQRKRRRAQALAQGREIVERPYHPKLHSAHIKRWRQFVKSEQKTLCKLHDAHVKRRNRYVYMKVKLKEFHANHVDYQKQRSARQRDAMKPHYIKSLLVSAGFDSGAVNPQLISLKSEHLFLRRVSKQLKQALEQTTKEGNHES